MKTDYRTSLIDDYLTGELDDRRLSEFDNTLKMDSNFAMEVELQMEIFEAIRDERKMLLRNTLSELRKKESRKFFINLHSWKVQAAAASIAVLLLIGGGLTINLSTTTPTNESLFSEYFNPESALLTVRSNSGSYTTIEQGMLLYVQEDFEQAIITFSKEPENIIGILYTGFSYMKTNEYAKAEAQFLSIIQMNDNLFVDQAEWNLGLCYLVSGKEIEATKIFSKIAEGTTVYNSKASKLLLEKGNN